MRLTRRTIEGSTRRASASRCSHEVGGQAPEAESPYSLESFGVGETYIAVGEALTPWVELYGRFGPLPTVGVLLNVDNRGGALRRSERQRLYKERRDCLNSGPPSHGGEGQRM